MGEFLERLQSLPVERRIYSLQTLPIHLAQAQNLKNLRQILTTYDFLQSKVNLIGIASLLSDYSLVKHEPLQLIQNALRLSAHVLADNPSLLAGQLLGRLLNEKYDDILSLIRQAKEFRGDPWLRPIRASLETVQGPLINTFNHDATIRVVKFTPDSTRVISASSDRTVKVWDVETAQELFSFNGHQDAVYALAVSPDGTWLASGSNDATVQLWSLKTGKRIGNVLMGHPQSVKGIAISPSGKRVVSVSADCSIVWDVKEQKQLYKRVGYPSYHAPVIFLDEDNRILLPSNDHSLLLWNTDTGEETLWATAGNPLAPVMSIARSPDGRHVASSSDNGKIYIWDVEQGRLVSSFGEQSYMVNQVAFLPDGKRLLAATDNNLVTLWDIDHEQVLGSLSESLEGIKTVAVSADGQFTATGSSDHKVLLWNWPKLENMMTASADNRSAISRIWVFDTKVITQNALGDITIWDLDAGHKLDDFSGFRHIGNLGGGKVLLLQTKDEELKVYDTTQGMIVDRLPGKSPVVATIDGRVICRMEDGGLHVLDSKDRSIRHSLGKNASDQVTDLVLDRNERVVLAILREPGKPHGSWGVVWSLTNYQELGRIRISKEWLSEFCLSSDSQYAIFGGKDGKLLTWKIPGPTPPWYRHIIHHRKVLHAHNREITGIVATLDNDVIITTADDRSIKAWSLRENRSLFIIDNIKGSQVAITADGEKAIVFKDELEANIEVWDRHGRSPISRFRADHLPKLGLARNTNGSMRIQPTHFFIIDQSLHRSKGAFLPNFSLSVRDLDTGKQFVSFEGDSLWTAVAVSNAGDRIIAGDQAGRVHFLDLIC